MAKEKLAKVKVSRYGEVEGLLGSEERGTEAKVKTTNVSKQRHTRVFMSECWCLVDDGEKRTVKSQLHRWLTLPPFTI